MMRHLAVCAALFCAFQLSAHAGALLPSQEEHDLITVKTCRDHEVLSSLKAAIDSSLQANSVLARGMRAGDVRLEAVWIDRPAVICSTTVAVKGIRRADRLYGYLGGIVLHHQIRRRTRRKQTISVPT